MASPKPPISRSSSSSPSVAIELDPVAAKATSKPKLRRSWIAENAKKNRNITIESKNEAQGNTGTKTGNNVIDDSLTESESKMPQKRRYQPPEEMIENEADSGTAIVTNRAVKLPKLDPDGRSQPGDEGLGEKNELKELVDRVKCEPPSEPSYTNLEDDKFSVEEINLKCELEELNYTVQMKREPSLEATYINMKDEKITIEESDIKSEVLNAEFDSTESQPVGIESSTEKRRRHPRSLQFSRIVSRLTNEPEREPWPDRPVGQASEVVQTPRGLRPTGQSAAGGRRREGREPLPLLINPMECAEALDLSDEEIDDLLATSSGQSHLRRWIEGVRRPQGEHQDIERTVDRPECHEAVPPSPATSTAGHTGNAGAVRSRSTSSVDSVEADGRPSTSGAVATSEPVDSEGEGGSALDSDYDDEFVAPVQSGDLARRRDIPDDDELEAPVRKVVDAVLGAMDEEVARLPGLSPSYAWEADFEGFRGSRETFSGPTPGALKDYETPYDVFTDIWSGDIMETIVRETNRYARQEIDKMRADGRLKASSRVRKWVDTDVDEMMLLFAVYMYMGIDKRPSQKEYWTKDKVLEMPGFRALMTYDRYILLSKFLHFIDNLDASPNSGSSEGVQLPAKLRKLAPVISHLNHKFASLYSLDRQISIGESLTLFKGRLSWAQAIRSKTARFGTKSFELCESRTGYIYKFEIYAGKSSGDDSSDADVPLSVDLGCKSARAVLDLLKGLERRGHCVTMDNFYNSPALARWLKGQGFDCLGTLRANRRNVPGDIAEFPKNAAKGTIIARHCGDVSIVAWKDTKVVPVISTYHDAETHVGTRAGERLEEPACVREYNGTKGGVDLRDQKLSMYLLERKRGLKWYVKMFKRLLNAAIHNAFVLLASSLARQNKPLMTHREFRYALAKSLFERHRPAPPQDVPEHAGEHMRLRSDVVHVPLNLKGPKNRRSCAVCYRHGTRKFVTSVCGTCDEYLCLGGCWREWHTSTTLKEKDARGRKRSRK